MKQKNSVFSLSIRLRIERPTKVFLVWKVAAIVLMAILKMWLWNRV